MSERKNFGRLKKGVLDIPDLIEIQTKSFADFLQTKLGEHMTENVIYFINYNFVFSYINNR